MRRVGFQAHDGRIFHVLTGRGGVMVAIHSEPRAADALAVLHSYGGGNAAIGAGWTGLGSEFRFWVPVPFEVPDGQVREAGTFVCDQLAPTPRRGGAK